MFLLCRLPNVRYAAVAATLFLVVNATGVSAVTGWSGPTRVFSGTYREVSMAVDANGKVHAAARGDSGLWYLTNRTGSWTRARLTTNRLDGWDGTPSIDVDDSNRVHVAFTRHTCLDCTPRSEQDVYYLSDRDRPAGTFPEEATWIDQGEAPSLEVVNGKTYLAYAHWRPGTELDVIPEVRFLTNATGPWTNVRVADHATNPSLRVASNGRARIAYQGEYGEIGYAAAASLRGNFGTEWLPATEGGVKPRLALDATDRPHIAWTSNEASARGGGTYYAKKLRNTWIGGRFTTIKWDVKLATDSLNRPHLAVLGPVEGVYYYRAVNGSLTRQTLSAPTIATSVAIRIGRNGKPVVLYTTSGGVPNGVYQARKT